VDRSAALDGKITALTTSEMPDPRGFVTTVVRAIFEEFIELDGEDFLSFDASELENDGLDGELNEAFPDRDFPHDALDYDPTVLGLIDAILLSWDGAMPVSVEMTDDGPVWTSSMDREMVGFDD